MNSYNVPGSKCFISFNIFKRLNEINKLRRKRNTLLEKKNIIDMKRENGIK